MKPKPFASLNHFTVPRVRAIGPTPLLFDCVGAGIPAHRVFMSAGPSRVIKNERPASENPGSWNPMLSL